MVDYSILPGSLDLFELMVNYVAGGILVSIILWTLILFFTGIIGRLSFQSIFIIIFTFLGVVTVGYMGANAAIIIFLIAIYYMVKGGINWFNEMK